MSDSEVQSPTFSLSDNYFSLLDCVENFDIDLSVLKTSYLALQQRVHPDRFTTEDAASQREAVQLTAYLNQAYETLKSPLKRAIYMLECRGISFNADSATHSDTEFLFAQLEMREALEHTGDLHESDSALEELYGRAKHEYSQYQQDFKRCYSAENWDAATQAIHKMMFASKLLEEIRQKEEQLDR